MEHHPIGRIFIPEKSKRSLQANRACPSPHLRKNGGSDGPNRRPKPPLQLRAHVLPSPALISPQHLSIRLHGMASVKNRPDGILHDNSHIRMEIKDVRTALQLNPNPV